MRSLMVIAALAGSACTADLELGDPQVSSVCVSDAPLGFDGDRDGEATAELDLDPLGLEAPADSRVTLRSAIMTAAEGVVDLGFAERVRVSLEDTIAGPLAIADAAVFGGTSVELAGDPNIDVGAHLRDGASRLRVAVTGDVPASRWTVLVDLCFDLHGADLETP